MVLTKIFAHRGSAGTHPENTMISFYEAVRAGADGIELDVHLSKEGEVVIIHDELVNRTTNGKGYVKDMTVKELKALNANHTFHGLAETARIPLLEEVLTMLLHTDMLLNIELKNNVFFYKGLEEKVIQLVRMYNLEERVILSSFNHYSLVHCVSLAPEMETAPLYRDGLYMPWVYAQAIRAGAIHPNIKAAPDFIIQQAMEYGIAVRPYTVNAESQMEKLFRINCSGFITDFPEKAVALRSSFV